MGPAQRHGTTKHGISTPHSLDARTLLGKWEVGGRWRRRQLASHSETWDIECWNFLPSEDLQGWLHPSGLHTSCLNRSRDGKMHPAGSEVAPIRTCYVWKNLLSIYISLQSQRAKPYSDSMQGPVITWTSPGDIYRELQAWKHQAWPKSLQTIQNTNTSLIFIISFLPSTWTKGGYLLLPENTPPRLLAHTVWQEQELLGLAQEMTHMETWTDGCTWQSQSIAY